MRNIPGKKTSSQNAFCPQQKSEHKKHNHTTTAMGGNNNPSKARRIIASHYASHAYTNRGKDDAWNEEIEMNEEEQN